MSHDVGQIINGLGITADSLDGDVLVADAIVIMKCVQGDGSVTLLLAESESLDWIARVGMLKVALTIEEQRGYRDADD